MGLIYWQWVWKVDSSGKLGWYNFWIDCFEIDQRIFSVDFWRARLVHPCLCRFAASSIWCKSKQKSLYYPKLPKFLAQSKLRWNLKTEVSLWKRIKRFESTLHGRNLKRQQQPVILDLWLRKTRLGNSHVYTKMQSLRFEEPSFESSVFVTD